MGERYKFETIASIKTTAFSRFKLTRHDHITRLREDEESEVWSKIQKFYADYNCLTNVQLFKHNNYFVLKDKGKIIAGIQANKVEWRIEAMPGLIGKFLVKTLPYLPFIRRIINPKKYQFLSTDGLFWEAGYEDQIRTLLEGVLFEKNCYSMLLWTDANDTKINTALKHSKLGILQKLKTDNAVNLVAKFNNVSEIDVAAMKNKTHYISGFDCT